TLWEESTRVPLIVVAPGLTTPGSTSAEAVSLLDVYPTLVDIAGLPTPAHLDGESLKPLLQDPGATRDRPAVSVRGFGNYAVRDESYRYIRYADGSEELYDHRNDPGEWTNLAGEARFGAVKERLAGFLPVDAAPSYTAGE
ncbi:MAG TPA: sulfatase/phosphatase domain-containing protein, partial [Woeseiaceae bacterium]|nr:sulfatase/phosphatase domain-containing protein [Woeseiaceae bacterium]